MSSRLKGAGRLGAGLAVVGGGATALYLLTGRGKPKVGLQRSKRRRKRLRKFLIMNERIEQKKLKL